MEPNKSLNLDDLPDAQREIAECIGLDAYKKLTEYTGGCSIYVAQNGKLEKKIRNQMIRKDYQLGIPIRLIAKKYNLTEVRIRQILNKRK